jgi:hypothetical protein
MRKILLLACGLFALGAAAVVLVPGVVLRPFSPQTPRALALAYRLREAAPVAAPALAVLALALAGASFRRARWWLRAGLATAVAVALGAAWLARQNHFEWMFNPLPDPAYASVAEAAAFVDPADMLIAVEKNGDAVAYPVRQMAYHHLVNDQVGGVPVVSTY